MQEEVLLGPAELVFLLDDMLRKLEFRLTAGPTKKAPFLKVAKKHLSKTLGRGGSNDSKPLLQLSDLFCVSLQARSDKSVGFSHLQQRSSSDVAAFCVQLLPALCSHMENCHNHFQVNKMSKMFNSSINT